MIISRRKAPPSTEKLDVIFHVKLQCEENAIYQRAHMVNNVNALENSGEYGILKKIRSTIIHIVQT